MPRAHGGCSGEGCQSGGDGWSYGTLEQSPRAGGRKERGGRMTCYCTHSAIHVSAMYLWLLN